jgi:hypothetical protein
MSNATLDPKPKTTTRRTRKPSATAPAMEPTECDITMTLGAWREATVTVTGPVEFRDENLKAAIIEFLDSTRSYHEVNARCEDEIEAAEQRGVVAKDAMDKLIEGLGAGYAVSFRGLLFGVVAVDAWPAMPVLNLID